MNKEPQKLLVEALNSGKYKQTTGVLRRLDVNGNPIGHCCLGVACDVYHEITGKGQWDDQYFLVENHSNSTSLPPAVMEWFGFTDRNPLIPKHIPENPRGFGSLIFANDNGLNFEDISKIIEVL